MNHLERDFWHLLSKHKEALPGAVERVENACSPGMPDLLVSFEGDYWVELKAVDSEFSIDAESPGKFLSMLRPAQAAWHARHASKGSVIFVLVKYKNAICLWLCVSAERYKLVCVFPMIKKSFVYEALARSLYTARKDKQ